MSTQPIKDCFVESSRLDKVWDKRVMVLRHSYDRMVRTGVPEVDFKKFHLRHDLVGAVVDHYVGDFQILRLRYRIPLMAHIQLHRVAGLLAAAIMRYRPITLKEGFKPANSAEHGLNERFALATAVAICAEKYAANSHDVNAIVAKNPLLADWMRRMHFLLSTRNYTSESLVMCFDLLCTVLFPENYQGVHPMPVGTQVYPVE